jgi:uncharacterized membrane protein
MSDVPVQIIVAAFTDEEGADQALDQLKQAKKEHLIGIKDAAIIRRDPNNKLHIKETADMGGGKGAAIGGTIGAVVGLVTGPGVVLTTSTGAVIGGLVAKLHDAGIPNDRLRDIGSALKPGTSAIVAVIDHVWVQQVEQELARQGAQVMTEAIKEDIAQQLDANRDVVYSAIVSDGGTVATRVTSDGPTKDGGAGATTGQGTVAGQSTGAAAGTAIGDATKTDQGTAAAGVTPPAPDTGASSAQANV